MYLVSVIKLPISSPITKILSGNVLVEDLEEWILKETEKCQEEYSLIITNVTLVTKPFAEKYKKLLPTNQQKGEQPCSTSKRLSTT